MELITTLWTSYHFWTLLHKTNFWNIQNTLEIIMELISTLCQKYSTQENVVFYGIKIDFDQFLIIISLEMNGVLTTKKMNSFKNETIYIFVKAPSFDDLKQRLEERGETSQNIEKRLNRAKQELEMAENTKGLFDGFIITDIPHIAYSQFKQLIFNKINNI